MSVGGSLGLRFFYRRSFRQLGTNETRFLIETFIRRFANREGGLRGNTYPGARIEYIGRRLSSRSHPPFSMHRFVRRSVHSLVSADGSINQESVLHGLLVEAFSDGGFAHELARAPRGLQRMDIFHELPGSPPKPPNWADYIDICATASPVGHKNVPVHSQVVEVKKDPLTDPERNLTQLMKYVDFLATHYTNGNYDPISAMLIAKDFSADFRRTRSKLARRTFLLGPRTQDPHRFGMAVQGWSSYAMSGTGAADASFWQKRRRFQMSGRGR